MITFTQTPATCMADWHTEVARFKEAALLQVRHALVTLGLAKTPFAVDEAGQSIVLDRSRLPDPQQWHRHLCQALNGELAHSSAAGDAVQALEAHVWHVYDSHLHGLLQATHQVVTVDQGYRLNTWLAEHDGYHATIVTGTKVVARTEHGTRTRLDAMLVALWQLKQLCQTPAEGNEH